MSTTSRDLRTSGDLVMAPRVPHGLAAAVEGLTREVIRHRPEDIYVFAAQHFEELLKLRDEYGAVTNLPGKSTNTAALREMNQAVKKRNNTEKSCVVKSSKEKSAGGWSMNETARVLERHRSIFGDKGKKVSPDEVRALANEKENKSRRPRDDVEKFTNTNSHRRRGSSERFVRKKISPKDQEPQDNKSKSDSYNGNPKIISQIPTLTQSTGLLAKDIKSELRKNRNSSRDGRSIRERTEKKASEMSERLEIADRQSGATKKTLMRSSHHRRSLDKLNDVEDVLYYGKRIVTDNQKQKTDETERGFSKSFSKMPRTLSMDRVREFVVEKFRASESYEELRSTNYVDKVQKVIDEASPTILRRVKELSIRSAGRSRGYESVDESTSTASTRSDKSNQTDDVRSRSAMSASRRSRRTTRRSKSKSKSKSKTSCADSLEGIETLASETELQIKETTRNEIDIGRKLKKKRSSANNCLLSGESDASDYTDVTRKASASSSISLPAVRPPSSKNHSRSVSRSDSDNLVLPPIPPEVPKSAKLREELILPSLQIAKEVIRSAETPGAEEDAVLIDDTVEVELNLPDAPTEEVFKDSLNVTPDIAASPRPDSLEPNGSGVRNYDSGDNIAELKSQLNEIDSKNDGEKVDVRPDGPGGIEAEENHGVKERLMEIEETEKRIEKILETETRESQEENVDAKSVKDQLIEIQEAEERLRNILDPDFVNVEKSGESETRENQKVADDSGMKEKLVEIEETEKRIEKIFDTDVRGVQEDLNDPGIKEKLVEIEEFEKRIEKILDSEVQEVQTEKIEDEINEELVEIEKTGEGVEKILDPETQEIQKDQNDPGMKEKLMEIEETEKRIEKILDSEVQEIQKDQNDPGMKEKLMEIEETEKRIERILDSEAPEVSKDEVDDGIKEKLIEIEEAEKRIDKIFESEDSEVQSVRPDADFMKDKLLEIEEAEKRLKDVFDSTSVEEKKQNLDLKDSAGQNNSAPKTPFIPEIPSEYVTAANQEEITQEKEDDERAVTATENNQLSKQSANPEDPGKELAERNETKAQEGELKIEQFSSGTPDSLGNSYILTEGSPYEIPDSVTTVIIPERQLDTPSSDILEIVLEDDLGSKSFHDTVDSKEREESPEEGNSEISLKNILDNFGEIVQQETVHPSSPMDVDFIKNLKTSNDVVIPKKDLGLITEEEDKDFTETDVVVHVATPILHDIAESEEILEQDEARNSPSNKSNDPEDRNHESSCEDVKLEASETSEVQEIGSSGTLEPAKEPGEAENQVIGDSLSPEDRTESIDDHQTALNRRTRSLETLEPEVTSPTTTAIGSLQQNVTDSATTESTDEVKETTISDDGGNTAAESSVTSPSCGEEIGARNSESSNEVKETTISDRPADEIGKNLYSLVPQCHGSMPHVPELNLDSLQDITVSSFQLSDDATAEEDSDAGQPQTEDDASQTTATANDAHESQEYEPVHEDIIVKESVIVKEDPCNKVTTYVTEPNTENLDPRTPESDSVSIKEKTDTSESAEKGFSESERVIENDDAKDPQNITEDEHEKVPENEPEGVYHETVKDLGDKVPEKAHEEIANDVAKEKPEEVIEIGVEKVHEEEIEEIRENVAEDIAEKVPEEEPKEMNEEAAQKVNQEVPEKIHEEVTETNPEKEHEEVFQEKPERVLENLNEDITINVPEEKSAVEAKELSEKIREDVAEEVPEEELEKTVQDGVERIHEEVVAEEHGVKNEHEEGIAESLITSELDTTSLNDFKELEAAIEEEYPKDIILEYVEVENNLESKSRAISSASKVDRSLEKIDSNSAMRVLPEVSGSTNPEEITNESLTTTKTDDLVSTNLDPPKAEVVTNDLDDEDDNHGEKTEYHIYVPEVATSDECSTTESSTFNSAATKIQAGVRGFLTRRRLQSAQRRSSTLDSVPSIQDSLAADGPHLEPIEEVGLAQAATTIQSNYRGYKARKRLRREDAVQKTTMSVENAFFGNGLQHTGEFHDCLPLPPPPAFYHHERDDRSAISQDVPEISVSVLAGSEENEQNEVNSVTENRDGVTETPTMTTTKEESLEDESTFDLIVNKYPYAGDEGLNLVVLAGNDAVLQSQYLNFITSIEEVHNETESLIPVNDPSKTVDGFSTLKSNVGIESLPLDNPDTDSVQDSSISLREPLAVPGSPTGVIIEELSKTDEEMSMPVDVTSVSSTNDVKHGTNLDNNDQVSQVQDDSLDLPGLSLDVHPAEVQMLMKCEEEEGKNCLEMGKSKDVVEEEGNVSLAHDVPQDTSLGTMSFSMNVDDMLGLGVESDPSTSKMKPIFEVTVTPRDLLKLTNRSHGSQASGDRVESPVTMMQIVPKSVEDKSDRSEDERDIEKSEITDTMKVVDETINRTINKIRQDYISQEKINDETVIENSPKNPIDIEIQQSSSNDDDESSDKTSKTFSIEKN